MNDAPQLPATGLSAAEVAERVARGQVNRVRRSHWAAYLDVVARNVFTLFNGLVVPAAVALFALGDYRAALAVSGMAITNTLLGLAQEVRGKWHLDKLTLLAETRARVLRDGLAQEVPAGDVVWGDHVLLAAGEPVVADGAVVESRFLEVDEALLTGESDPVPRKVGDNLLSGSFAVAGEGAYRADQVGGESFAQRTAAEARSYQYTSSPLQDSINRLVRALTAFAVLLCLSYGGLAFVRDFKEGELVSMSAATITSMVPVGLVLMTTFAFILGAVRMSARGAIVQRLNAVEAMASIDTLCMDKTGTLTTNQLCLAHVYVVAPELEELAVRDRLRLFASLSLDRGSKSLVALRAALGEATGELLDQLPFKSQNRYSAVRVRLAGRERVFALGACEALQAHLEAGGPEGWDATWKELLGTGLRLLLFAEGEPARPFAGSLEGFALRPLALIALSDELRPEAPAVLLSLAQQGISFKVISGDNPETVRATLAPLGAGADVPALRALAEGPVVTGAELEASATPGELIRERSVFGRVSPWQKVEIVKALKAQGRQVAMVGDGVNDVLPIKNAHLGIAMGDGSQASKTVSGLVLQTNDFGLLPQTLDEGRTIVRNLRRAAKLFLVKNVYTALLILLGMGLLGLPFPYLPQHVTLLNFLTIGAPALVIALSRERSTALRADFVREVAGFALGTGAVLGLAGLAMMFLSARVWNDTEVLQRTLLLSVLVLLGLTAFLRVLVHGEKGMLPGDWHLRWLAIALVPVYLGAMYVPLPEMRLGKVPIRSFADFFVLEPLNWQQWGRVLLVVVPACGVAWLSDHIRRPPARRADHGGGGAVPLARS